MKLLKHFTAVMNDFTMLIVIACALQSVNGDEYRTVETKDGQIRGIRKTTLLKKVDFFSFKGIRYGKSPTGDLRFKAPEPVDPWTPNVIDAFEHGRICWQPEIIPDHMPKSEDCLFLNVYVPADVQPNEKLAVLVYIHGGGFTRGTGNDDWNGPDFLLEHGVIVVTLNYRLGIFGFLNFDTPEHSGNMGLKDQQLALKWVHTNIEQFSGDINRITVFGESAGGVSAHFQVLSTESRQYFRNAIPISGVADNLWSFSNKEDHFKLAYRISEELKTPQNTTEGLIQLLKSVPAEQIFEYALLNLRFYERTSMLVLSPIVERKDAIRPFIVEYPEEIYKKSKIESDVMFGFCSLEEIYVYLQSNPLIFDVNGLDEHFNLVLPFREAQFDFDSPEYRKIAAEIRRAYFGDAAINENTLKQYLNLLSDVNFGYGIAKAAKQHAAKSPAKSYYFRFSFESKLNVFKKASDAAHIPGTSHGDDLCHVFRCGAVQQIYDEILSTPDDEQSKVSLKTIENITKLYANFAKFGTPNPNNENRFLPIENEKMNFLDVTNDGLVPGVNPNQKAIELWARIEQQVHEINAKSLKSSRDGL